MKYLAKRLLLKRVINEKDLYTFNKIKKLYGLDFINKIQNMFNDLNIHENFNAQFNNKYIDVLGPVEAPRFLLRGQYRYRILLKGNNRKNLNKFTRQMLDLSPKPPLVKVIVDVDPYSFM